MGLTGSKNLLGVTASMSSLDSGDTLYFDYTNRILKSATTNSTVDAWEKNYSNLTLASLNNRDVNSSYHLTDSSQGVEGEMSIKTYDKWGFNMGNPYKTEHTLITKANYYHLSEIQH